MTTCTLPSTTSRRSPTMMQVTCSSSESMPSGIGGKWRRELQERASDSSSNTSKETYMLVNQMNCGYLISDRVVIEDHSSLWTQDKTQAMEFLTYELATKVRDHLATLEDAPIVVVRV